MPKSEAKSKRALIDSDSDDEEDLEEVRIKNCSYQIMKIELKSRIPKNLGQIALSPTDWKALHVQGIDIPHSILRNLHSHPCICKICTNRTKAYILVLYVSCAMLIYAHFQFKFESYLICAIFIPS